LTPLFLPFFLLNLLFGCPYVLLRDGATCRHIDTGLYILTQHQIPTTTYTWSINPAYPWLTHELGTDVLFGLMYQLFGLNGVVVAGALPLGIALLCTLVLGRMRGLGRFSAWIFWIPVFLCTTIHWSARPHAISYVFFLAFYYLAFVSKATPLKKALICGGLSILWVNFHGSVVLALLILGSKLAGDLLDLILRRKVDSQTEPPNFKWQNFNWQAYLLPLAATFLGSLLNLRGLAFWDYLFAYLSHPQITQKGLEWAPFDIKMFPGSPAYLVLIALWLGLNLAARFLPPTAELLLFVAFAGSGFMSARLMPYLALLALPSFGPAWQKLRGGAPVSAKKNGMVPWFVSAFLTLLVIAVYLFDGQYKQQDMYVATQPTKTVKCIESLPPETQGFNYDNWGPYIYFRLHRKIFVDEKTDFYPSQFISDYKVMLGAEKGWQALFDKYKLQFALVPKNGPLDHALGQEKNWRRVEEDEAGVFYLRAAN